MSRTLVLTLNDLLNHEKKKVSPKTFILEKIDTTKKYCDPKIGARILQKGLRANNEILLYERFESKFM